MDDDLFIFDDQFDDDELTKQLVEDYYDDLSEGIDFSLSYDF